MIRSVLHWKDFLEEEQRVPVTKRLQKDQV
jgi:hypothetical protein